MGKNKYTIKYSATYINQFNNILKYIVNNLNNKIAAENFYKKVVKEIEARSYNPEAYEKHISARKRQYTYYKIYVKNYTVFYTVKDNTMEVRRILYSKMNFNKQI